MLKLEKHDKCSFSFSLFQLKFDTLDLIGIFEHVFDNLKVDPSNHKVGTACSFKIPNHPSLYFVFCRFRLVFN